MTKREAVRQTEQERTLCALGFTAAEAEQLRRISMTLHRWHEGECGSDHACLVRGKGWDRDTGSFVYDDDGAPYWEHSGGSGKAQYTKTADREKGAKRRLAGILDRVNKARHRCEHPQAGLRYYVQGDPRGAALYILRPGDVPEGKDEGSYYSRGVCVW